MLKQGCTVLIINFHYRNADHNSRLPEAIRVIFLQWIPWLLCMSRPGHKITLSAIKMENKVNAIGLLNYRKMANDSFFLDASVGKLARRGPTTSAVAPFSLPAQQRAGHRRLPHKRHSSRPIRLGGSSCAPSTADRCNQAPFQLVVVLLLTGRRTLPAVVLDRSVSGFPAWPNRVDGAGQSQAASGIKRYLEGDSRDHQEDQG